MAVPSLLRVLVPFLVLVSLLRPVHSELLGTILISRHGTRAPNLVTSLLCPANADNLARYLQLDISLEGVTGRGMHQLLQLGEYTRSVYVDSGFLKPYYSNEEMYIRAVGEDRTLQSAVAWGQGLYPAGRSAIGYPSSLPPPLPVYTLPDELDVLLENRKAGCHQRLKVDVAEYDSTIGEEQRALYARLLAELEQLCGVNLTEAIDGSGDNYGDAIKDITDNWTFDFIEHFPPLPGLTIPKLLQFRTFAIEQLIGRILGTQEQITYMNGDLPLSVLRSFRSLIEHHENRSSSLAVKPLKFIAYHGHREMVYALAAFFDMRFNISYPALPEGAIPPATSVFFELHRVEEGNKGKRKRRHGERKEGEEEEGKWESDYEVRAVLWSPCDAYEPPAAAIDTRNLTQIVNVTIRNSSHAHPTANRTAAHNVTHPLSRSREKDDEEGQVQEAVECGAHPIAISKCPHGVCSFAQFRRVVHEQIHSTGNWRKLCAYDQETGREEYSDSRRSDTKQAGAGRTSADHSKSGQQKPPKEPLAKAQHSEEKRHGASEEEQDSEEEQGQWYGDWSVLLWVAIAAVLLGALGYWWFVMRRARGRAEYEQVPGRP